MNPVLCLNVTRRKHRVEPENCRKKRKVSTYLWFAETYEANIYSGDWFDKQISLDNFDTEKTFKHDKVLQLLM